MATTEGYVTGPGSRSTEGDRRSSDEIRRSIEQQRDDLDVTAEELQRKLAPRELAEQLWNDMRTRVSSGAGDVAGVVRRHPVPLGLIGAGIAWWIYETSSGRGFAFGNGGHRYEDENLGVGSMSTGSYRPGSGYGSREDAYGEGASADSGAYADRGAYAESDRGWRQRSMDAAYRSGERLRSGATHARQGFSDAIDKNPLALGAACFSLGLLAAIAVPASRWENERMGETRDRVTRRARSAAKAAAVGAAEQGARVAQEAADRIKEEAVRPASSHATGSTGSEYRSKTGTSPSSGTGASSGSWSSGSGTQSSRTSSPSTTSSTTSSKPRSESDAPDPWDPNRTSRE